LDKQTNKDIMKTYINIKTSELKSGMIVAMHGSDFTVTSDSIELEHRKGTFVADCAIIEKLPSSDYMALLNDYDYIQGNDFATWSVKN